MSQIYYAILTAVGEAKLANAAALGTQLQISRMAVGDGGGNLPVPIRTQTALVGEQYRADLNTLQVDPANASQIIAELVIPETTGGWWIREMGIYDAAGDLIAVSNCPPSYKPQMAEGSGRTQVLRMVLIVSSTAAVQLKIDPSVVLATREFVTTTVNARISEELAKLDGKNSVRVATTTAIALSGLQTIDGIALSEGDRVLVKNQADAKTNGIYTAAAGIWSRSTDADASIEVTPGLLVPVDQGAVSGDSLWQLTTDAPTTLGSTALQFEMVAGRTGVTVGTYDQLSVDLRGRVVGGTRSTITSLSADTTLTAAQRGLVLISANAGNRTIMLPAADAALGVVDFILRRTDSTANACTIVAAGTNVIMLDTTAAAGGQSSTELLFAGDYLHLRSDGAGKWWCVAQALIPPSLTAAVTAYKAAGTYSYSVPSVLRSGRRRARVTVTGGGAGGGHSESTTTAGGGGGGGGRGYAILDLTGVTTVSVTVGAGGAGAPGGAMASGSAGGTSSFGAYLSATGGNGGSTPSGGAAGTVAGATVIVPVSPTTAGTASALGSGGGFGGAGAALGWTQGNDGRSPGGGGAGGAGTSGTRGGGAGAPGEVLIEVA